MKTNTIYLIITILLVSCSTSSEVNNPSTETPNDDGLWSIPISEVRDGGPGKDGIPSIDNPNFSTIDEVDFLNDTDLVVGILRGNDAKAYPHIILDWHEVVNDRIDNSFFTLNYCPLTGTAFAWESKTGGVKTTFGVSGLLYNANLILYDRNTDSNWSQLKLECVNGDLMGDEPELFHVVETTWETWKTLYPNTKVLNTQTGFSRTYGVSPYGDYAINHNRFIFSPSIINDALPNKERVHAIIKGDKSKVYQFSHFNSGKAIKDVFNEDEFLVVGDSNLIYSYKLDSDYKNLDFEYDFNSAQGVFFNDNEGNKWSVFGEAIDGPRKGETLPSVKSVISYWFAIAAFYPNPKIYSNQ